MKDKKEYIVIRDSFILGVLGDIIMYGCLMCGKCNTACPICKNCECYNLNVLATK